MNNEVPIFLELFSGTMTMSKTAKEFGFRVFSIDIDEQLEPSLCADILELTAEQIVEHCGGKPAVIWASPDCTQWSFARGAKNEFSKAAKLKGKPLSEDAIHARNLIIKTLSLIEELDPHYFFVENPFHGALKHQQEVRSLPFVDVYYCGYDHPTQKHTRIWGNFPPSLRWKTTCSHHTHAEGVQTTQTNARTRAEIPVLLCRSVCASCIIGQISGWPQRESLEDF